MNISRKILLITSAAFLTLPLYSMDIFAADVDAFPSQENIVLTREQSIKKATSILLNHAPTFQTASKLCMDAAATLMTNPNQHNLSQSLLDEATQWLGSSVLMGKSINFEDKNIDVAVHQDPKVLAANFLRVAIMMKRNWAHFESAASFLSLNPNNLMLQDIIHSVSEIKQSYSEQDYSLFSQTDEEKELFGEFPAFDWQSLLIDPLQNVENLLNPFVKNMTVSNISRKEQLYKEHLPSKFLMFINQQEYVLQDILLNKLNRKCVINVIYENTDLTKNSFAVDNNYVEDFLKFHNFFKNNKKRRMTYINKILKEHYEKTENLLREFEGYTQKQTIQEILKDLPSYPVKKKRKKKKVKNKNDAQHIVSQETLPEISASPVVSVEEVMNAPEISPVKGPAIEEEYVWDPDAFKKMCEDYASKKQNANNTDVPHTTQQFYQKIPSMTKNVVEKFLDIFGNQLGDPRKKNKNDYQRQGWGSIEDLKDVLTKDGWIFNNQSGSSAISFSMPNTSHEIIAAQLKIHNDHGVGTQDMREITRHFIIKGLEYAGYNEEFFTKYYKQHFLKK